MTIVIRNETPDDREAVGEVTKRAFAASEPGYHGEAELIETLHANCRQRLALVACDDDEIVGHILFTPVQLRQPDRTLHGMGLGPMSVAPEYQREGIGSRLVREGLQRLLEDDYPFVVVLGHVEFYQRLAFLPADEFNLTHGFSGIPQSVFLIRVLDPTVLQSSTAGRVYYRPEFGQQHEL